MKQEIKNKQKGRNLHENTIEDKQSHDVVTGIFAKLWNNNVRSTCSARRCGAIGERAIEYERGGAIVCRDIDQCLVKAGVAAIANQILDICGVVILVAAANAELLTQAKYWEGRIDRVGGRSIRCAGIVERDWVGKVVWIYAP